MVQGVRRLVHTSCNFLFKEVNDVVKDSSGNGDVFVHPWGVCNGGYFDRHEVFVAETSALVFCPGTGHLIDFEDVVSKIEFLWPEEVIPVNVKIIQPVLSEVHASGEQGRMSQEQMEGEEGVLRVVLDDSEVL